MLKSFLKINQILNGPPGSEAVSAKSAKNRLYPSGAQWARKIYESLILPSNCFIVGKYLKSRGHLFSFCRKTYRVNY